MGIYQMKAERMSNRVLKVCMECHGISSSCTDGQVYYQWGPDTSDFDYEECSCKCHKEVGWTH